MLIQAIRKKYQPSVFFSKFEFTLSGFFMQGRILSICDNVLSCNTFISVLRHFIFITNIKHIQIYQYALVIRQDRCLHLGVFMVINSISHKCLKLKHRKKTRKIIYSIFNFLHLVYMYIIKIFKAQVNFYRFDKEFLSKSCTKLRRFMEINNYNNYFIRFLEFLFKRF